MYAAPEIRLFLLTTLAELGAQLRQGFRQPVTITEKSSAADLCTELDLLLQAQLTQRLREYLPGSVVFAEEDYATLPAHQLGAAFLDTFQHAEWLWIIDPIDGTSNFAHGFPLSTLSVALAHRGQLVSSVVYNPVSGECFSADDRHAYFTEQLDDGALTGSFAAADACSGSVAAAETTLAPTPAREAKAWALSTSFPHREILHPSPYRDELLDCFADLVTGCATLRRPVCASLELCYVAAGFQDATLAVDSKPWDAAAAALIAQHSGVRFTAFDFYGNTGLPAFAAPCYLAARGGHQPLETLAEKISNLTAKVHGAVSATRL